jgi:transcriptional regulator with XRE-family HTH domain
MSHITEIGRNLRLARKRKFPQDDMRGFAIRLGVSRATLQKMEKGDLTVTLAKYAEAARLLGCLDAFRHLFVIEGSLFDE